MVSSLGHFPVSDALILFSVSTSSRRCFTAGSESPSTSSAGRGTDTFRCFTQHFHEVEVLSCGNGMSFTLK
uniref:Secreted protein n=1 Tax=Knipowitschia caucasica TaxID=637954 RepID=A0AAV2M6H4_KNICA